MGKKAIIIGAGPAGLTAAYELLKRTDIMPIILEKSGDIGGISKTVNYKGNRIDIGGHRFFSKSDRVMKWWLNIMPIQAEAERHFTLTYQRRSRTIRSEEPFPRQSGQDTPDKVMLVRPRLSRIYFLRKFFTYPIRLSVDTLRKLGLARTIGILVSYTRAKLFPRRPENSLEDFFINRFGDKLYRLFFKDYTEKVWGVPCTKISAEWGAQRIKGISIASALAHAIRSLRPKTGSGKIPDDISQKGTETSLIEKFLYPKFGPGQLWEEVARQVQEMGGTIRMQQEVKRIHTENHGVTAIETLDTASGETYRYEGDYFFSTMPVQELIAGMGAGVSAEVKEVAEGLQYRDFITVGVLLTKLSPTRLLPDTWIYIQEKDVKVGRLQIFNNWSPFMVKDPETVWIGMEFFCNKGDDFWEMEDKDIRAAAMLELEKMGLADPQDILDSTVLRMEKTYPAYFGSYERFGEIRQFIDGFENLFLVGRNGMHKYNNSDHSMLTAMVAVDNICAGIKAKGNIWAINTEQEYHEEKEQAVSTQEGISDKESSFIGYLWRNKWNRAFLLIAGMAWLIQFLIFKFLYPFANYIPDSYSYLEAAYRNVDVNTWPVAYSKFLRIFSAFSHSDTLLVGFQYFFQQVSGLVFLASILYLFRPTRPLRLLLYVFFVFNPVALYLSDYIAADSLFVGLSFLWMAQLVWIVCRPRPWMIFVQALLLMLVFTVRYNAIYYPLIATLAFILSRQRVWLKGAGIVLGSILVLCSIWVTSNKMYAETGQRQFSAFGGWQLANNALYMYQDVRPDRSELVPARFKKLETMVRQHMDTLSKIKFTSEDSVAARFYLWSGRGPLVQYMEREWKKDSTTPYFKRWASEGPVYAAYGTWLIRKYPLTFIEKFIWPNVLRYAVPPLEFLGIYNMGSDSVNPMAKQWFGYKSLKVNNYYRSHKMTGVQWYPVFASLVNVLLLFSLIGFLIFNGMQKSEHGFGRVLWVVMGLWAVNMGFSVLASPITLRYQIFPTSVYFIFSIISLSYISLKE